MKTNGVKDLFKLATIYKYIKNLISGTDVKAFESVRIYLLVYIVISTIFSLFAISYMSDQAVIINKTKRTTDDTKEFVICIRSETSIYKDFSTNKEVPGNVLVGKIRKCLYEYDMRTRRKYE